MGAGLRDLGDSFQGEAKGPAALQKGQFTSRRLARRKGQPRRACLGEGIVARSSTRCKAGGRRWQSRVGWVAPRMGRTKSLLADLKPTIGGRTRESIAPVSLALMESMGRARGPPLVSQKVGGKATLAQKGVQEQGFAHPTMHSGPCMRMPTSMDVRGRGCLGSMRSNRAGDGQAIACPRQTLV